MRSGCFVSNWFGQEACEGVVGRGDDDLAARVEVLAGAVAALAQSVERILARLEHPAGGGGPTPVVIRPAATTADAVNAAHGDRCRRLAG